MKRIITVLLLLCTAIVQAQKADFTPKTESKVIANEEFTTLKKITHELQAIKAENEYLKTLIQKQNKLHQSCLVDEQFTHSEIVELNATNVKRKPKKVRKHYNTLPPPL